MPRCHVDGVTLRILPLDLKHTVIYIANLSLYARLGLGFLKLCGLALPHEFHIVGDMEVFYDFYSSMKILLNDHCSEL